MSDAMVHAARPMLRVLDVDAEVDERMSGDGLPPVFVPGNGFRRVKDSVHEPVRTGVWVGLAGVFTMFAALTSAAVVRQGSADDWEHIALPAIIYVNTAILFASSGTLEMARRKIRASYGSAAVRWIACTVVLGFVFLAGQVVAWTRLRARGVELGTGPSDAFFYVLTVLHALHVLGGTGGLLRVVRGLKTHTLRRSTIDGAAYYWHFMGVLWSCVLILLWLRF